MAPGVAKTFIKNLVTVLEIKYPTGNRSINGLLTTDEIKEELKEYRNRHRLILDSLDKVEWLLCEKYTKKLTRTEAQEVIETTMHMTEKDVHQSMEAVIHNLNTMHSRAGSQIPFSSFNYGTDTSEEGRMVIKYLLKATDEGLGNGETPIFPVQIFKVKEGVNYNPEDKNYDLYRMSMKVSAKRMYPNYAFIDAPFNKQYYEPNNINTEVSYMGCVDGREVVTYKLNGKLYVESIRRMFNRISGKTLNINEIKETMYIDTSKYDVEIYDSNKGNFVKNLKVIVNPNRNNWKLLKLSNGRSLIATDDHPLPIVGMGRTYVRDMTVGDMVPITLDQYSEEYEKPNTSVDVAWLFGIMLCSASYDKDVTIRLKIDRKDILKKIKSAISEIGFSATFTNVDVKEQDNENKEMYVDISIECGAKLKQFTEYLQSLFGGKQKQERQIPSSVFSWPMEYKKAFLKGMTDSEEHEVNKDSINKEVELQQKALMRAIEFKGKDNIEYATITSIEDIDFKEPSFDVETESDRFDISGILSHNCRTRVMGNIHDKSREITTSRGNLSFTSINLPRIAIKANNRVKGAGNIEKFYELLDEKLELVKRQLYERYKTQCRKHPRNYPFLMGQGIWLDSDKLGPDDDISEVLKHGTLGIGFIGLAETLTMLIGEHHGESERAQELGLEIVRHMRQKIDEYAEETQMNYSLLATPAEGLSGRFIRVDKRLYGEIPGVTDKAYYTNSTHIPVYFNIGAFEKIELEAPYHDLCNGGHICYIELNGDPLKNIDAFESVLRCMHDEGVGYGAINHPVDMDPVCGYIGIIDDVCPRCGRKDGEPMTQEMWDKLKGINKSVNVRTCGACGDIFEEMDRTPNHL